MDVAVPPQQQHEEAPAPAFKQPEQPAQQEQRPPPMAPQEPAAGEGAAETAAAAQTSVGVEDAARVAGNGVAGEINPSVTHLAPAAKAAAAPAAMAATNGSTGPVAAAGGKVFNFRKLEVSLGRVLACSVLMRGISGEVQERSAVYD